MFYLAVAAKWRQNATPVRGSGYSHEKTWTRARADRMPLCCQKTIPKLVRTREECTASLAPLRVVVYEVSDVVCGLME